jgi:hypothetical protein
VKDKAVRETEGKVPEPPLELVDLAAKLPKITQDELVIYMNAKHNYRIARATYETYRAAITMRLLLGSLIEPGNISALLDGDDELVLSNAKVQ